MNQNKMLRTFFHAAVAFSLLAAGCSTGASVEETDVPEPSVQEESGMENAADDCTESLDNAKTSAFL